MSRYTYAGKFTNPTEGMFVKENDDGKFYIAIPTYCDCGHECCSRPQIGDRPHTNGMLFDEHEEAEEWIEATREFFEDDYDSYLEENHYEIAQQERYEDFRNEY